MSKELKTVAMYAATIALTIWVLTKMTKAPGVKSTVSKPAKGSGAGLVSHMARVQQMGTVAAAETIDAFATASKTTGIPLALLLGVGERESDFNPFARGTSGDVGMMQVTRVALDDLAAHGVITSAGAWWNAINNSNNLTAQALSGAWYLWLIRDQYLPGLQAAYPTVPAETLWLAAYNGGPNLKAGLDPSYVTAVQLYRDNWTSETAVVL